MFAVFSSGFAPALALLTFFYLKDSLREPLSVIIKLFIFGVLLVFPIMFIQYTITAEGIIDHPMIHSIFTASLEEFFKGFIFMYIVFHHTTFNRAYDGILYAVTIGLGFATFENILFLFTNGVEYAFSRAIFPVSSHALFGVIMGYRFGKAKRYPEKKAKHLWLAFLIPFCLHAIYNYILKVIPGGWIYILIPFMIFLWMIGLKRVRTATS